MERHKLFTVGVTIKAIDGLIEIVAGLAILLSNQLSRLVNYLIQSELIEDPHDSIANFVNHLMPALFHKAVLFAGIYLLAHGIIKIFLSFGLIKRKLWAYPTAITFFSIFLVYQLYRFFFISQSSILLALSVIDCFIIYFSWKEYQYLKSTK